jgi:hypothetical protein
LLAKQPADRFGSAAELAQLLEQCLAHVQQPATVPLPAACRVGQAQRRPTTLPKRSHILVAAGLLTLAIGATAAFLAIPKSPSAVPLSPSAAGIVSEPELDWNSAAAAIQSISADAAVLEQRAAELWDERPISIPAKNQPEAIP